MRYFLQSIFFLIISLFNSCQTVAQDGFKEMDIDQACNLCLIESRIEDYKKIEVSAITSNKSKQYVDSITHMKDSLNSLLQDIVNSYCFGSSFKVMDSARILCFSQYHFGENIDSNRRDIILKTLFEEILEVKSGFVLSENNLINNFVPKTNQKGEMYIREKGDIIIIKDIQAWKAERLKEWSEWMDRIDPLIHEITGKYYKDLMPLEKYAFDFYLRSSSSPPEE